MDYLREYVYESCILADDHEPIKTYLIPGLIMSLLEHAIERSGSWRKVYEESASFTQINPSKYFDRDTLDDIYTDILLKVNDELFQLTGIVEYKHPRYYEFLSDRTLIVYVNKNEKCTPEECDD